MQLGSDRHRLLAGQVDVMMSLVDLPLGKYLAQRFDEIVLMSHLSEQRLLQAMDRSSHPQVRIPLGKK